MTRRTQTYMILPSSGKIVVNATIVHIAATIAHISEPTRLRVTAKDIRFRAYKEER